MRRYGGECGDSYGDIRDSAENTGILRRYQGFCRECGDSAEIAVILRIFQKG